MLGLVLFSNQVACLVLWHSTFYAPPLQMFSVAGSGQNVASIVKLSMCFISLYCFLSVQYLNYISVLQLIALNIFYKQHIKTYVLSKTLKISPTCFGHLATILRETQYLSLLQLLNYRCSSMPASDNRK